MKESNLVIVKLDHIEENSMAKEWMYWSEV